MNLLQDGYGLQAQDINQLFTQSGYYVYNGCSVSPGTNDMTVQVGSGQVVFNENLVSVSAQDNVSLSTANSDPRKDIVYLDGTGSLQVATGTAEPAQPTGQTRRDAYRPAPPALENTDAVVLAEVWVPAGATDITSTDIIDRRVFVPTRFDSLTVDGSSVLNSDLTVDGITTFNGNVTLSGSGTDITVDGSGTFNSDVSIAGPLSVDGSNVTEKTGGKDTVPVSITHTSWGSGLSNEEVFRYTAPPGESLEVHSLSIEPKGGGSVSGLSIDVYDSTAGNIIASDSADGSPTTGNPIGSSGSGNTVLIRLSNSSGSSQQASITVTLLRV